jgi:drug/metabolite transporter (DMT)-like permease
MVLGVLGPLLGVGGSSLGVIDPVGAAWGIAAAVIYSVYIIAGTRFAAGVPPIFASTIIISSAAVVYTVWGTLSGELRLDITGEVWLLAIAIAVICTVIAIVTFFAGLKLVGPSRAAIASTFEPAVTVFLAPLILQERITPEQIVGGALVLLSVMVLQWHTRPQVQESI